MDHGDSADVVILLFDKGLVKALIYRMKSVQHECSQRNPRYESLPEASR